MRMSDWSSDVCSSDLDQARIDLADDIPAEDEPADHARRVILDQHVAVLQHLLDQRDRARVLSIDGGALLRPHGAGDRKSVVSGKRVLVRVDRGGRRLIKTNNIGPQTTIL